MPHVSTMCPNTPTRKEEADIDSNESNDSTVAGAGDNQGGNATHGLLAPVTNGHEPVGHGATQAVIQTPAQPRAQAQPPADLQQARPVEDGKEVAYALTQEQTEATARMGPAGAEAAFWITYAVNGHDGSLSNTFASYSEHFGFGAQPVSEVDQRKVNRWMDGTSGCTFVRVAPADYARFQPYLRVLQLSNDTVARLNPRAESPWNGGGIVQFEVCTGTSTVLIPPHRPGPLPSVRVSVCPPA
eukprot:gene4721-4902_t